MHDKQYFYFQYMKSFLQTLFFIGNNQTHMGGGKNKKKHQSRKNSIKNGQEQKVEDSKQQQESYAIADQEKHQHNQQQSIDLHLDLGKLKKLSEGTDAQYQASIILQKQGSVQTQRTKEQGELKKWQQAKTDRILIKNQTIKSKVLSNRLAYLEDASEDIKKIAKRTAFKMDKFQFSQFDLFEKIERAIFIFGQSRIGKSSLFLMLNDIILHPSSKGPVTIDTSQDSPYHKDIIGHGGIAKTKLPNIKQMLLTPQDIINQKSKGKKVYIVDCPGFIDSEGFQDQFTNKYYINKVFNIVQQARFILCMQESDIINYNRNSLITTLSGFLAFFKTDSPNLDKIIDCTTIVITKTQQLGQGKQTLDDYAEGIVQQFSNKGKINQSKVIEKINKQKRVYYFPMAKKNQQNYEPKLAKKLKQQQIKKDFYRINQLQDIVFEFNQNDTAETTRRKGESFLEIYQYTNLQVVEMCKIIFRAYEQISNNLIRGQAQNPKKFQFIEEIKKYVQDQDIYQSKSNLQGRKNKLLVIMKKLELKNEEKPFAQIMFLKKIAILNSQFSEKELKDNYQQIIKDNYQKVIFGYLDNILNYGYVDKDCSQFYNFAYILKRRLDYIKIIQKIRPIVEQDYYIRIMDTLCGSGFKLTEKKRQFIKNFKLRQSSQDLKYLKFVEGFFQNQDYNASNQQIDSKQQIRRIKQQIAKKQKQIANKQKQIANKQKQIDSKQQIRRIKQQIDKKQKQIANIAKNQQQYKKQGQILQYIRQGLIIAVIFEQAVIFQKQQDFKKAFIYYEKCRLLSEFHNRQRNSGQKYRQVKVQLYKRLGQLCEKKFNAYSLAIEYFNVIEFDQSICRCFRLKLASAEKQKNQIYLQYAKFLASICQVGKVKQLLQQAYEALDFSKSNNFSVTVQIKSLISNILNKQKTMQKAYVGRIQIEDVYNRPDQNKILKHMQKEMPDLCQIIKNIKESI